MRGIRSVATHRAGSAVNIFHPDTPTRARRASRETLGLFDTPPDRNQIRFCVTLVAMLFIASLAVWPVGRVRLPEVNAFIPSIDAIMALGEVITAMLLYAQSAVFRSRALAVLGTSYLFVGLMMIPHALTFPGAFSATGLLHAGTNTTAFLAEFRRAAIPLGIIAYVLLKTADLPAESRMLRRPPNFALYIAAAVILAIAVTVGIILAQDLLPAFYANRRDTVRSQAVPIELMIFALLASATVALFRKRSSVLDLWLLTALAISLIQSLLIMAAVARFTVGFYFLYALILSAHLIILFALLAEANRLYARLALSTALRNEERDARLMSMEAVAAAISHEVGQPVCAANMSASAAEKWLTLADPDVEKAIASLRGAVDSGRRAFEVIKGMRTLFGAASGSQTEFDLNELAREAAALVGEELAAKEIGLDLALAEELPRVRADRVLMRRVLLNLYLNAIEATETSKRRPRRIEICSRAVGGEEVLLQVSDTGTGICAEDLPHMFNAFLVAKSGSSGLGLSLCRAIVEEHGGTLSVSNGQMDHGATFHLQMPSSNLAGR